MARHTTQDFIRGDLRNQIRTLGIVGAVGILVMALVIAMIWIIYPRTTAPRGIELELLIPSLGPGIKPGSKVLLRGAEIGEVTAVSAPEVGTVQVNVVLDPGAGGVLTDKFGVDFRPENYFGITAVNLIAHQGGSPLRDGQVIRRDASPDYTMSTMLENGSLVVDGTLTKQMISNLDKVIRYADGLSPLIETSVIVADSVARTQRHLPSALLHKMNALTDEFPSFNRGVMSALYAITNSPYNRLPDGTRGVPDAFHQETDESLALASSDLFGAAGALLKSHDAQLTPLTTLVKYMTDPLPNIIGGGMTMAKVRQVLSGLEASFTGTGQQKTLQLRLVFSTMPGIAGPLAALGVRPAPREGGR